MHLHFLGLSGTFMSALAILAKQAGFEVTGCDANCYPPISDLLIANNIKWVEGYEDATLALAADLVIVGNAMKRGTPVLEAILNARKAYTSGPEWLAQNILKNYRVIAVAGTHGKTTTTSMIAKILHHAGLNPGFLIGGVSADLNTSANLGNGKWFVIEADEYDTAFFDKRPKFMHYRPEIAILNNLEFDHADIYPNLAAIEQQFHYLVRTIPSNGLIIKPQHDAALNRVMALGTYSAIEDCNIVGPRPNLRPPPTSRDLFAGSSRLGLGPTDWYAELLDDSGQSFKVYYQNKHFLDINWPLIGAFNVENALAAIAACHRAGVDANLIKAALEDFTPVKRRLEVKGTINGVTVYDDFAHHPTAIEKTLQALKQSKRHQRILVVIEFASYTMRSGFHQNELAQALGGANKVFALKPTEFSLESVFKTLACPHEICINTDSIVTEVTAHAKDGDAILVMSNRGFENIHQRIIDELN